MPCAKLYIALSESGEAQGASVLSLHRKSQYSEPNTHFFNCLKHQADKLASIYDVHHRYHVG